MILEAAIGDAYGAGFEFAPREKIDTANTLTQYETHPLFTSIHGKYTDDTQMAIGVAELMLEGGAWTRLSIANKFVEVFKRDPREGYARGFHGLLTEVQSGQELLDRIRPASTRNGAAMRAWPLGLYPDIPQLLELAALQATITHDTGVGRISAQAIALMMHYCYYQKGPLAGLPEFLEIHQDIQWSTDWSGEVQIDGKETVHAVLSLMVRAESLMQLLQDSVALGGDVDTVASLCLAMASAVPAVQQELPLWTSETLENGPYGRDFLTQLDTKLLTAWPAP